MKTTLTPAPELSDLYFQPTPRVPATREAMEGGSMRTIETYFHERLGPDYRLPYTKFPAGLYEELTQGESSIFALLEKEHPDWLYRHYALLAHVETPASVPGTPEIYLYILLEDPHSNRLMVQFFQKHQENNDVVKAILAKLKTHSDVMDQVYRDFLRHQDSPDSPRYFIINNAAI
jgi:hypothetical protein